MKQLLKEKQFESWKHNTYLLLTDYCSMLRKWRLIWRQLWLLAVCAGRHYRLEGNANYYEPLNLYCTTGCRARGTQITPHTEYDKISESYFNENEALLSDRTAL